jgi:hypothetical protein
MDPALAIVPELPSAIKRWIDEALRR